MTTSVIINSCCLKIDFSYFLTVWRQYHSMLVLLVLAPHWLSIISHIVNWHNNLKYLLLFGKLLLPCFYFEGNWVFKSAVILCVPAAESSFVSSLLVSYWLVSTQQKRNTDMHCWVFYKIGMSEYIAICICSTI